MFILALILLRIKEQKMLPILRIPGAPPGFGGELGRDSRPAARIPGNWQQGREGRGVPLSSLPTGKTVNPVGRTDAARCGMGTTIFVSGGRAKMQRDSERKQGETRLLSASEVAKMLSLSRLHVQTLAVSRELPGIWMENTLLFDLRDVENYLRTHRKETLAIA